MPTNDTSPDRHPTRTSIQEAAEELGLTLSPAERNDYRELVAGAASGIVDFPDRFDPGLRPETLDGRSGGSRPDETEDPLNAWVTRCTVEPTGTGALDGLSVGLKDSIALAGYDLTLGSRVIDGFVPRIDAPVVARLLRSGAQVVGKHNMESFAWSGTGEFSDFGPVLNPHDSDYLAGGSSSGSAAATANGECDLAIGTDQAGSIRIPSAWCGLVGLKPTHGLVPYTGIIPLEPSIDHAGPMARCVDHVARAMDAIAGVHAVDGIPLDPRQPETLSAGSYASATENSVSDLSVAVLEEGFGWDASDPAVDTAVRDAADALEPLGVDVTEVSIPMHRRGVDAWASIATLGGARLLTGSGVLTGHGGWEWSRLAGVFDAFTDARADDYPPSVKRSLLTSAYLEDRYGTEPYARARQSALELRRRYAETLAEHDALLLPTTVTRPFEHDPDLDRVEALEREVATILNTCPFNLTGHPALTVPCGSRDGLPVGTMLVGSRFDDATLLALGSALESTVESPSLA